MPQDDHVAIKPTAPAPLPRTAKAQVDAPVLGIGAVGCVHHPALTPAEFARHTCEVGN